VRRKPASTINISRTPQRGSRVIVITRGGVVTGEDRVTPENTTKESRVRRATEKTQVFDLRKEKKMFEEARREFGRDQASSSKVQPKVRECGIPLAFNKYASPGEGKEVRRLVSFLYTFIDLIKDERDVQELQHLIRQHEPGKVDPLLNRAVHKVSRKRRTKKELHLNAQIGDYDIDYVVLDLGSKVNVMTKHTWELMGKPKLIYSSIRLRMAN
jgi:hypothetical protein